MRGRATVLAVCLAGVLAAPAGAFASGGALAQLPGRAECVSNDAYSGSPGLCRQAIGIDGAQSVAVTAAGTDSLYVAGTQSDAVAAFARDPGTGLPTQISGTGGCVAASLSGCANGNALDAPDWVTVSPDGANVYATSYNSDAVVAFSRDPATGAIAQLPGTAGCTTSAASAGACASGSGLGGAAQIAVSPDGADAYAVSYADGALTTFSRAAGGTLTETGCLSNATLAGCTAAGNLAGAASVAISPDGGFVYVAARTSQAVTIYGRNPATGALTALAGTNGCVSETGSSSCAAGNGLESPNSIAISPDGLHVYVSSFGCGQGCAGDTVAVFSRDPTTGVLTQLPGAAGCLSGGGADPTCTPAPVLGGDFAVTTSPDGAYTYVTAYQSNAVAAFSADPSSGALTALPGLAQCASADGSGGQCAQATALNHPHQTVLSPDGRFAYTVSNQSDALDVFATVGAQSAPPSASSPPVLSGPTGVGGTVTASAGAWGGDQTGYAYRWERCDTAGGNCAAVAGASALYTLAGQAAVSRYPVTAEDTGHTIRVVVTAINSAGRTTATSAAVPVVAAPTILKPPAISGTPALGKTLTTSTGLWSGIPTSFLYQWFACNGKGLGCTVIAGATTATLVVGAGQVGQTIRVAVTALGPGGPGISASGPTAKVTAPAPGVIALPTIVGTTRIGRTLTASTGLWSGDPTAFSYQWLDCSASGGQCVAIKGATRSKYRLRREDAGHRVRVVVTARNRWSASKATSKATKLLGKVIDELTCRLTSRPASPGFRLLCSLKLDAGRLPASKHLGGVIFQGRKLAAIAIGTVTKSGQVRLFVKKMGRFGSGRFAMKLFIRKDGYGVVNETILVRIRS